MNDLDTLRPEVRDALFNVGKRCDAEVFDTLTAELLRLAGENARLNKIESLATEQRLQMEDVELYLMDVSQPDDEDAPWCDRMKSAIELLIQDCNDAVGQKNKAEAELAALKARIAESVIATVSEYGVVSGVDSNPRSVRGKRVRLVVEE